MEASRKKETQLIMNVILIILVFLFFLSKSKKEKETHSRLKAVLYIDMEVNGVPLKVSRW